MRFLHNRPKALLVSTSLSIECISHHAPMFALLRNGKARVDRRSRAILTGARCRQLAPLNVRVISVDQLVLTAERPEYMLGPARFHSVESSMNAAEIR